ncbi:hypothetical protein [Nocardia testacea]|uniref:hypothetical protein n=1 Tax=Nocardia testacea TaxID=248551 RepID=UPI00340F6AB8
MSHFSSRSIHSRLATATSYLTSTPLLIVATFVLAFVIQVSMLLTVGRAPAETLLPASPEPAVVAQTDMPDCVMFCSEPPPAEMAIGAPGQTANAFSASTSSSPIEPECWLLCEPAEVSASPFSDPPARAV